MKPDPLEIETAIQISRPAADVFEAIVDPSKMSNYFISRGSGRLEEGRKILWKFPEFDTEFTIRVGKTETNKYISYVWGADKTETLVEIKLTPKKANQSTLVTVTEKSRENDEQGINWLKGNTAGWANFLACLKAYLEYGINLRKGAFDFMTEQP